MALSSTQRSLCNKMMNDFDKIISPIVANKNAVKSALRDFRNKLDGFNFSPDTATVDNELDRLKGELAGKIPSSNTDDLLDMKDFMDRCPYLQGDSPIGALIGTMNGIMDEINKLLLSSTIPEFELGSMGSFVNKLLAGINIPGGKNIADLFKLGDKLIECLVGACGSQDPAYINAATEYSTTLNELYDEMGIQSDPNDPNYGKVDYQSIYDNALITVDDQFKISKAIEGSDELKDIGAKSVKDSVSAAKGMMKGGLF